MADRTALQKVSGLLSTVFMMLSLIAHSRAAAQILQIDFLPQFAHAREHGQSRTFVMVLTQAGGL
jgi:hypothetical protein